MSASGSSVHSDAEPEQPSRIPRPGRLLTRGRPGTRSQSAAAAALLASSRTASSRSASATPSPSGSRYMLPSQPPIPNPNSPPSSVNTSAPIDPTTIAQIVSATLAAVNNNTASTSTGKLLKQSDLPTFKGYSLDGDDARSHLDSLETIFALARTPECDKTAYASLSFPTNSPAYAWYVEQRDLGLFRSTQSGDAPGVLRYSLFSQAFLIRFATPTSRRYALEDLWDRFTQKGTVNDHHIKFTKLLQRLNQVDIRPQDHVIASKYLRSLRPEIFQIIRNKSNSHISFEEVHKLAIEAEYQLKPGPHTPKLQGIFPSSSNGGGGGGGPPPGGPGDSDKKPKPDKKKCKWCAWHKWNSSHETKDCKKIQELKDKGEWKNKE